MSDTAAHGQAVLSLPKGGGAIKGIGETFQANLFTGTANHSVPIALSPGRNGFGPQLTLGYSSGNGNGIFGLGWDLALPRITRKTEKGLPRYDDGDVYVLSGSEDLVRCLREVVDPDSGVTTWVPEDPIVRGDHTVSRYRPRTEGLFARIERWVHTTGDTHWRTITKDNVTSLFGNTAGTRLADPAGDQRVHEWLLHETFDALGNHSLCEYATDDPALYAGGPDERLPETFERRRVASNRYPRRLYYGNLPDPLLDAQQRPVTYPDGAAVGHLRDGRRYAFEVVFDYGEWDLPTALPHPSPSPADQPEVFGGDRPTSSTHRPVPIRDDRFSSFRAGFEIRTLRRCRRVLMFHHFAELGGPTLVRSTDFTYTTDADTRMSLLGAATVTGYDKDEQGRYRSASMPPVAFSYSAFEPRRQRYQPLAAVGGDLPALGLNEPTMALVDLFGDGLPDVLHTGPLGVRYWRNLGNGTLDRPRTLPGMPAGISLDQPGIGFGDMAGNGIADLLVNAAPLAGFFETTTQGAWKRFTPYEADPGFAPQDPNIRMVDLTGDGRADALMTRDAQFLWFPCLGEKGFGPPQSIARNHDMDQFPDVHFDDPAGRVRLADMTGDGLTDIVRVHNGRIDYWPNLGYGRFGTRISMADAPHLDVDFEPRRMFLADLNGTGCSDLVYVDARQVHFWFNQSGNGWSGRQTILGTPVTTDASALQFADVFGTGTATLVWSRDLADAQDRNYQALDFCGGVKPYVLVGMDNNMGATTLVSYAPSTRHFLADMAHGAPWITPLPFPVQVVDTVETIDHVSRTKRVCTYKYHHGHYDGREREFCGFGRVDQFDTESFEDFSRPGLHGDDTQFANSAAAHHVPPVETRSWFHTGVDLDDRGTHPLDAHDLTARFQQEYDHHDGRAIPLDDHDVERGGAPAEAYRALRGAQVRTEVYGRDGTAKAAHPYQVSESRYRVTQVQPRSTNQHAVYFSHQVESVAYHYERNPADPRISHGLTLAVDDFGNPLKTLSIGYGRRRPDDDLPTQADRDRQTQTLVTFTETRFTNAIDDPALPDTYRAPVPAETLSHELTGFTPIVPGAERFSSAEWLADDFARIVGAPAIGYDEDPDPTVPQRRLVEQVRTVYRKDDLTDLLALGVLESLALPGETRRLAFTAGLLQHIYGDRVDDTTLVEGGFVAGDEPGTWWSPSGRVFSSPGQTDTPAEELAFAQQHFFTAHRTRDPFGNTATIRSDPAVLLAVETIDAVGNRTLAEHDYRVLQPVRLTDPNGNRADVVFDTLGFVAASAVQGKATETLGDSLAGCAPDLSAEQRLAFLADPVTQAAPLLGNATTRIVYDLERFQREQQPVCAAVLTRETHASDPLPADGPAGRTGRVQLSISYSDGFGREVQKKVPAEAGTVVEGGPPVSSRWVGSGWTILNNKGKPVRQFEPFFDDTHAFRYDQRVGVSTIVCYDPLERVVATLRPDHAWDKVVFDPWQQATWDVNDTVLIDHPTDDPDVGGLLAGLDTAAYLPTWHQQRRGGDLGADQLAAAVKAAMHSATPSVVHADALGRPFLTIAHNRFRYSDLALADPPVEEHLQSRVTMDIQGNPRAAADAQGRVVMRQTYDMRGTVAYRTSMEAGQRWVLDDVTGRPVRAWDDRGHVCRHEFDALRRPLRTFVRGTDPDHPDREVLSERIVYGEQHPQAAQRNLRGKQYVLVDQAGVTIVEDYDFTGNPLGAARRLAEEYKHAVDWSAMESALPTGAAPLDPAALIDALAPALERETYVSRVRYDALNRPVQLITPRSDAPGARRNVVQPVYNDAKLLERVHVWLDHPDEPDALLDPALEPPSSAGVSNIDYDAKGRRTSIDYPNGSRTTYAYDPLTDRLVQLRTQRSAAFPADCPQPPVQGWPGCQVQNLRYAYDPVGNVTHISDDAQQAVFFRNKRVEPSADYTYDAIYRLIEATGREHLGQLGAPAPGSYNDRPRTGLLLSASDGTALGRYLERFVYDPVGNLSELAHRGSDPASPGWTRSYAYAEPSQLEAGRSSNRLTSTTVGESTDTYSSNADGYDAHGNMLRMPQLQAIGWDHRDQLTMSQRQAVNAADDDGVLHHGERTYYVYDAAGRRVRKVTERANGTRKQERRDLGAFEVFRSYDASGTTATLQRETLHVTDDKQRIALVETRTLGDDGSPEQLVRYQFGNHLGSASLELDEQSQIISYEEYYAYGGTSYQAGRTNAEVNSKRYRYSGKERDEETGLSYFGVRYYLAAIGRWASADPAMLKDGPNLYCFTRANPVTLTDAVGTDSKSSTAATTALVHDFEEVVERRHSLGSASPITLGGGDNEKRMVNALISIGEHSLPNCSTKISTDDLFDRGTQVLAKALHVEKQVSGAAARGDAARVMAPAVVGLYEEQVLGVGYYAVAETAFQHWDLEESRKNNRNALPIVIGHVIAAWGLQPKGSGKTPAASPRRPPSGGGRAVGGGRAGGGGGGGGRSGGGGSPQPLRVVSPVFRYMERDLLVVETSVGRQGMYRSSGENSGLPNTWLPFDEIFEQDHLMFSKDWWNKQNYTRDPSNQWGRFGSAEFHSISQQLGARNIPASPVTLEDAFHVNTILDFFGARVIGNMKFRPTGDAPKVFDP